ncbi:MAG: PAS domain S-box protein [Acidobacteria bacterium]|nr:PAS domain S-box protein [Acidobacteriota bacterium]
MAISHRDALEITQGQPGNSDTRLAGLLGRAPIAIAYLDGEDHRYKFVNELYVRAAGREQASDLVGLPIREALPELEGSGVYELLDGVFRTGTAYHGKDFKVPIRQAASGLVEDRYFDFSYDPVLSDKAEVEGIFVLAVDMTERVANRRVIEESEERLRLAQEAAEVGTWEWDPVENKRTLSPEMHRMYGTDARTSDEEIYRIWSSRVYPADWPQMQYAMAECQRTGTLELEYRYQHPERGLRYHHSKGRRMVGSSRFFGVVGDITNRKRSEEALHRREEEFRSLADAMPQLVWMADPDGYVYWFNQRWYDYTGTTADQNCGWGWRSVHDPQGSEQVLSRWKDSLESGNPFEIVSRLKDKSGEFRPFLTRAVPLRDSAGTITRWFGTSTDISGELKIRREIENSQAKLGEALVASQRLAAIVESSDDAIIGKDLNGIVTSWNPCAERMFGYTAEEMIGQSIRNTIPQALFADEDRIMSAVSRGERTEHFETVRTRKDGECIEVSLTLSPVYDADGNITGVASISRDISQQKKVEKALHTTERLATVGRMAATIAHEINNPLEAVTNLVYLAQSCMTDEAGKGFLQHAQQELARVALLTKQTLGFYRETTGARQLTLGELVVPLVSVFSARARNKQISIETQIRQDPKIIGIPGEIRQLFANLLNNSIDAVPNNGRIVIRVERGRERSGAMRCGARLTVCDNGPGIALDIRKKLFEPFFTTKTEVGTGLGLWVSSNVVQKHEGTIKVKSSAHTGKSWTVFSVFFPSTPVPQAAATEDH